jgi:hypothetical protein
MSLDLMPYLAPKGKRGTTAWQETGGHAQAYGVTRREIRVIRRKLDCLNPNLRKVQLNTRWKDACNQRRPLRQDEQ